MFTQMHMKNFKSWQDTGDVRLAPLTGFFGTNSSGKSSLLQMLLLLKQTTESNDRNLVLKTGSLQEGYVNLGTVQEITYGDTDRLTLGVSWDLLSDITMSFVVSITDSTLSYATISNMNFDVEIIAEPNRLAVERFTYRGGDYYSASMQQVNPDEYTVEVRIGDDSPAIHRHELAGHVSKPNKCYGFPDEAQTYYAAVPRLSQHEYFFEQQFARLHYLGPLRDYPQRVYTWGGERPSNVGLKGELAVAALLASRHAPVYEGESITLEERVAQWLVDLGLAHAFEAKALAGNGVLYEIRLKRTPSSPPVLISDMGFGVSQVLPVLVLCYYAPEGSTLIFEQPELHLHPAVQSGLADVFIDVMKRRNIQIIVESHSEHLIRRLQRRIAEEVITPEQTALYFCDMGDQGSTIQALDVDPYGNIRNWPPQFFGDLTADLYEMAQTGIRRQMSQ